MSKVLHLPFTNNYIENRVLRLKEEIIDADVDYIDPLLSAMLRHLEGTKDYEENLYLQECFQYMLAALASYRQFSGKIKIDY